MTTEVKKPIRKPSFKIVTPQTRTRYLKLLIYAGFGIGKTTLAGSSCAIPQMNDVIMVDAESGDLSLDGYDNLDAVQVTNYKEVARVQEFLKLHCRLRDVAEQNYGDDSQLFDAEAGEAAEEKLKELEERLRGETIDRAPRHYKTVIVDSLAEVETYCMYQLLGVNDSTKLDEEVATAEWAEYKRNHQMIQRLVRGFRDLPMNVIFTCPQSYVQDDLKRMKYSPALTGKLSTQIQGFMDMVGYLVVGKENDQGILPRRLYVQPSSTGKFDAKNRFARYKKSYFDIPEEGGMELILREIGLLESQES